MKGNQEHMSKHRPVATIKLTDATLEAAYLVDAVQGLMTRVRMTSDKGLKAAIDYLAEWSEEEQNEEDRPQIEAMLGLLQEQHALGPLDDEDEDEDGDEEDSNEEEDDSAAQALKEEDDGNTGNTGGTLQ
jgi:hypothetical protein